MLANIPFIMIGTLSFKLGKTVMDKDPGFYNTEIHEGVTNLESIRKV